MGTLSHTTSAATTILIQGIATVLIAFAFMPFLRERELKPKDKMKIDQLTKRSAEIS